jgi:antitoxin VapB
MGHQMAEIGKRELGIGATLGLVKRVLWRNRDLCKTPNGLLRSCHIQLLYTFPQEVVMSIGTVFVNNRTQAVRLPLDVRLPEGVQKVEIRVKGNERIITPLGQTWDSFFLGGPTVSDDFLPERATQHQPEREAL